MLLGAPPRQQGVLRTGTVRAPGVPPRCARADSSEPCRRGAGRIWAIAAAEGGGRVLLQSEESVPLAGWVAQSGRRKIKRDLTS